MNILRFFTFIPLIDWAALALFVLTWLLYATYARRRGHSGQASLLHATTRYRLEWMEQCTYREQRMVDSAITQVLSATPTFFCSTTILVIGGLLAMFSSGEKAQGLVSDLTFLARTTSTIFEFKLIVLLVIFIYAFFRFSWSMRTYTFVALVIGGMPPLEYFVGKDDQRAAYGITASKLLAIAAESFNDGLRAYYFAFAIVAWFVSPIALMFAIMVVVVVLYLREFKSELLKVLGG